MPLGKHFNNNCGAARQKLRFWNFTKPTWFETPSSKQILGKPPEFEIASGAETFNFAIVQINTQKIQKNIAASIRNPALRAPMVSKRKPRPQSRISSSPTGGLGAAQQAVAGASAQRLLAPAAGVHQKNWQENWQHETNQTKLNNMFAIWLRNIQ